MKLLLTSLLIAALGGIIGSLSTGALSAVAVIGAVIGALGSRVWSERRPLLAWYQAISASIRLLTRQQSQLASHVVPSLKFVNLLPNRHVPVESANYINLIYELDNRTFMEVHASNIRGSIRIEDSNPPCDFPSTIPALSVPPLEKNKLIWTYV